MRKTFRFLSGCAIAALMLGGLASCEDKDIDAPDSPGVADRDITQYMAVTISAPKDSPFGRALTENFDKGTEAENNITSLDFYFFDNSGNQVAKPWSPDALPSSKPGESDKDNVSKYVPIVIEVNIAQGANLPTQTICFANLPAEVKPLLEDKSIQAIRELDINYLVKGESFIMSNSVYFGTNAITGTKISRICATPITGKYFATYDEADAALKTDATPAQQAKVVEIFIERLAAKVKLTLDKDDIDPYTLINGEAAADATDKTINITFVPTLWFMNGTSSTEYITKRYGVQNADNSINYTPEYNDIVLKMKDSGLENAWNNELLSRSYWACSPSYYKNDYPITSDDVKDKVKTYSTRYLTYNEAYADANNANKTDKQACAAIDGGFSDSYIYTWETTTALSNIRGINNENPAASVACAVIAGYYTIDAATTQPSTFWIDTSEGSVIPTGETQSVVHGTLYQNENNAKARLIKRQQVILVKTGTEDAPVYTPASAADIAANLTLAHPDKNIRAAMANNSHIAANLVCLKFTVPTGTQTFYYRNTIDNKYDAITADNINKVNALLVNAGYLHRYHNGLARFSVPIRHLGWPTNDSDYFSKGKYQWEKLRIGDLGVVRNHVYDLQITGIGGLGTGISDPTDPVVPPVETLTQFVASKINVLSWRVVPTQEVPL